MKIEAILVKVLTNNPKQSNDSYISSIELYSLNFLLIMAQIKIAPNTVTWKLSETLLPKSQIIPINGNTKDSELTTNRNFALPKKINLEYLRSENDFKASITNEIRRTKFD